MNPTIVTLIEIVGSLFLGIILIIALYLILQSSKTSKLKSLQQNKFIIPLLAGLAMLNFIMINLIGADILDPTRSLALGELALILAINVPFIVVTIWQLVIRLHQA